MTALLLCVALAALQGKDLLIATERLASIENALVLDVRPADAFSSGHIPGAANLDIGSLSETRDGVAGLLKPLEQVHAALAAAGVDPAKHIVAYCGMEKPDDFKDAARMFWILEYVGYPQVSVLDGGLAKWKAEGRSLEQGPTSVKPAVIPDLKPREDLLATMEDVESAIKQGDKRLVDWRNADMYHGSKKADIVKAPGHIPTAKNLSSEEMVRGQDSTLKQAGTIEELAKTQGVDLNAPTITYCNSGRSASTGYFVLRMLGNKQVSLYDGSMAEWTASEKNKVECDAPVAKEK